MRGITTISEENLRFIAQDIGKRLIPYLTPEVVVKSFTPETVLKNFTPEARLEGLTPETRLEGLTSAERFIGLTPEEEKKQFERLAKKYGLAQGNGA
ncbi:MAG: hypothetical protein ACPGWR_12310 [Ardenticatenaceae bacterium]